MEMFLESVVSRPHKKFLNIIFNLKCELFTHFGSYFLKFSRRFGFSTRSLGHVMFSFTGTAQEAGAGGRSGAAGIPVHIDGVFFSMWLPSLFFWSKEGKHHVTKTSS